MHPFIKFTIRAVLGVIGAILIARLFWKVFDLTWVVILAVFMVGLAYAAERMRNNRR